MGITIRTPGDSPSVRHRSRHMTGRHHTRPSPLASCCRHGRVRRSSSPPEQWRRSAGSACRTSTWERSTASSPRWRRAAMPSTLPASPRSWRRCACRCGPSADPELTHPARRPRRPLRARGLFGRRCGPHVRPVRDRPRARHIGCRCVAGLPFPGRQPRPPPVEPGQGGALRRLPRHVAPRRCDRVGAVCHPPTPGQRPGSHPGPLRRTAGVTGRTRRAR